MRALFLIPGGSSEQLQSFAAAAAVADQLKAEVRRLREVLEFADCPPLCKCPPDVCRVGDALE